MLLRGPAEGGVRHRDAGPRASTCRPGPWWWSGSPSSAGSDTSALTSGEYQQLTGRAGRRGIDTVGHAFVLWSPATPFAQVARTAIAPPPDLVSSFHPTYNLAVNLVRRWSRDEAHRLLAASYGQWQAPAGSVSLSAQLDRRLAILERAGLRRRLDDDRGRPRPGLHLPRVGPPGHRGAPGRGCSTGWTRRCWPGWCRAFTFEARRAGDDQPGATAEHGGRPPGPARRRWPPSCGPTSGGSGCGRTRRPDAGTGPRGDRLGQGGHPGLGAHGSRRRPRGLRAQRPPGDRSGPPARPGGPRSRHPGRPPGWPWPSSDGGWWAPTTRRRLGSAPDPSVPS